MEGLPRIAGRRSVTASARCCAIFPPTAARMVIRCSPPTSTFASSANVGSEASINPASVNNVRNTLTFIFQYPFGGLLVRSHRSPCAIAGFYPHPNPLPAREREEREPHPNPLLARERERSFHRNSCGYALGHQCTDGMFSMLRWNSCVGAGCVRERSIYRQWQRGVVDSAASAL